MASPRKLPRLGAHTQTSGGMAKRSIAYAQEVKAEAIQVFASNPRGWAMPDANVEADTLFRDKALELDIETYVHAPFLINLGSPTVATYEKPKSTNSKSVGGVNSTLCAISSIVPGVTVLIFDNE